MISLYDGEVKNLLGPNYKADAEVQALSHALKTGMRFLLDRVDKAHVYADIDGMDEAALDLLVEELRTQYYDSSLDADTKRALVKTALQWHYREGTAGSVNELLKRLFGSTVTLEEWQSYGGAPYTFRFAMDSEDEYDSAEVIARLTDIVKNNMNERSHCTGLSELRTLEMPACPVCVMTATIHNTIEVSGL